MSEIQKFIIRFAVDPKISVSQHWGSLLQGVLMHQLPQDYAQALHTQDLRPYSQFVLFDKADHELLWTVTTLTEEASHYIGQALQTLPTFTRINKKQTIIELKDIQCVESTDYLSVMEHFLIDPPVLSRIDIQFLTSTTCKKDGVYTLYPEPFLLINNLYKRWNAFTSEAPLTEHIDPLSLSNTLSPTDYRLSLVPFSLEGRKVNAYKGRYTLNLRGEPLCTAMTAMLAYYGNYAGMGIKTAIGMGGVLVQLS